MSAETLCAQIAPARAARPLAIPTPSRAFRALVGCAVLLGLCGVLYAALQGDLFRPVRDAFDADGLSAALLRPSMLWAAMALVMLAVRSLLWFRYVPPPAANHADAPTLSVVIPAYNEGAMVERSIESVASAHYPSGRLEVIVVDDGSTDDTWHYIERAAKRFPHLVATMRLARNQGKRAALAAGIRRAKGQVLVTIDSDSVIEPQALLALAGPFRDPRVGAVAGKVVAFNRDSGVLAKMLHVRFILSFEFQRSVQSTYRTVYCCPGALSAYRASIVHEVLEKWLGQRFLGVPCTFGEDRALTNDILARGYDSVYQRAAVVHTLVPETYAKLAKMYLRWDRSYVREELRFARIVWRRPLIPMLLCVMEKLITNLRYPVAWLAMGLLAVKAVDDPSAVVRTLFSIGVASAFYMLYYLYSERSMRFVYGILYSYFAFFTLWWIFPYAVLTVRARSWLTR